MAITFDTTVGTLTYTPESERGVLNPFTITLLPIPVKHILQLEDKMIVQAEGTTFSNLGEFAFNVCRASVIDWNNMLDPIGTQIPCEVDSEGTPSESTIAKLGVALIKEISEVVHVISNDQRNIKVFFTDNI